MFILLGTMPTSKSEQNSMIVYLHVFFVSFMMDMLGEFEFTLANGILFERTDRRVSAVHFTIFSAMINMTGFIHKTYIFYLVDQLGIFLP